jgi:hypothetical protein
MAECAFCGEDRKLTDEHVWPEWLRIMLPDPEPEARNIRTLGEGNATGYRETKRDEGPRKVPSVVKIVCERHCNNGWMSGLENEAKRVLEPLIFGRRTELRTRDQRLIAFWTAKTMMVAEYTDPRTQATTTEQRHFLYDHREDLQLPPVVRVWMGYRTLREPLRFGYAHRGLRVDLKLGKQALDARLGDPNVQQTTFRIGRLVLVIVSTSLNLPRFDVGFGDFDTALRPIYPRPSHFRWPLGRELDNEAVGVITDAVLAMPIFR